MQEEKFQIVTLVIVVVAAVVIALLFTGCGHNAVTYSDGVGVEVGFIPDKFNFAVNFRYGKIFSAVVKEKAKVSLVTDASNSASGKSDSALAADTATGVKSTLTMETGDQVNGYVVDLEKAKQQKPDSGHAAEK